MKAKNLFFGALACLAFAACSNDDEPIVNGGAQAEGDKYIVVNIAVPSTATRAQYDDDDYANPDSQKEYEDGTEEESDIYDALFVFFNEQNNVTQVSYKSNIISSSSTESTEPYVERISSVVLALSEPNPNPASVLAIVNCPTELANNTAFATGTSLDNVLAKISNSYTVTKSVDNGESSEDKIYFIMSSSAFDKNNGLTKIKTENLQQWPAGTTDKENLPTDAVDAKAVDIYVERVAARVDVNKDANFNIQANKTDNTVKYQALQTDGSFKEVEMTVVPEVLGVHLSYTTPKSYVIKHEPMTAWTAGSIPWQDSKNMRSYWAQSVSLEETDNWGLVEYTKSTTIGSDEVQMYCHENTTSLNNDTKKADTKLVITAKLNVTIDGDAKDNATLVKYMTQIYLYDDFKSLVNNDCLNKYYWISGDDTWTNNWTTFLTLARVNKTTNKAYTVYPTFKEKGDSSEDFPTEIYVENTAYVDGGAEPKYTKVTNLATTNDSENDDVKVFLEDAIDNVMTTEIWCWQNGKAYYFVDINHLNNTKAIVRNHIYQLNLKTIYGLGTPVFWPVVDKDGNPGDGDDPDDPIPSNPDQPIDPEKPSDEAFYVTCQLNVLKWRLVGQQDVELEW